MYSKMSCVFSTGTALFRLNHWFLTLLSVQLSNQTVTPVLILVLSYSFTLLCLCGGACCRYSVGLDAHLRASGRPNPFPVGALEGARAS